MSNKYIPHLSLFLRSLIEFTLQLKPYFVVLHKMLARDLDLDPDSLKDKVVFKKIFNALDSSEFYQKIPKVRSFED